MKVVCVIVTYNIDKKIKDVVNSIKGQVDKVIIIDNCSDNSTIEILKNISIGLNELEVHINKENYGIAKALNTGVQKALIYNPDYILTLDHDSIVEQNMVKNMINSISNIEKTENIGIITPKVFDINKNDYLTKYGKEKIQIVQEPIQSGMLIKSDIFRKIGLFNEQMVIYYVDTEFCYRVLNNRYKIIQCNNAVLYHEEGKKTQKKIFGKVVFYNNYNEYAIYYRAKNYIYMMKHYRNRFTSKNRIIIDLIKILVFEKKCTNQLKAHLRGIYSGLLDK